MCTLSIYLDKVLLVKKEIEELYDDIPLFDEDELKKWIDDFQFEISSL